MNFQFTDEQKMLGDVVYQWACDWLEPQMEVLDERDEYPANLLKETGKLGINGITVAEEYGGSGLGYTEVCVAAENFGRISSALTMTWIAHCILCIDNINRNGTPEQKEKFVSPLVSGEKIGCLAMTEANAGSDVMSMKTTAMRTGNGSYLVNGSKIFITNGPVADTMLLYAKTAPDKGPHGISAFVFDTKVDGHSCSHLRKFGMRTSPTGEHGFSDMEIPGASLLGEENKGVRVLTGGLCTERIACAAAALGTMRAALELSVKYSKERIAFGKPISSFQMIQKKLADMYCSYQSSRWLTYSAATFVDSLEDKRGGKGTELDKMAAAAILYTSESGTKVCLDAVQIHGGYGYCLEYPVQRHLRDIKLWEIGAGTSEVRRMIIARELLRG